MKTYTVYILKCADDSYYTGVTNNIDLRFRQHNDGVNKGAYTHSRRPVKLVFTSRFYNIIDAISAEKQIKGWSRRKKEAIIDGDWKALKIFSACLNDTSHTRLKR